MFVLLLKRTLILVWIFCTAANASPLIAELSDKKIIINSSFDGADLMLFGSRNESGDVVAVVRGPSTKAVVRKKQNKYGIWVNRESEEFENIPIFYFIAASKDFANANKSIYFNSLKIGYDETISSLRLKKYDIMGESERAKREEFGKALLRTLKLAKLYNSKIVPINFIGDGLFRANIRFPDNTPTGKYSVEVYLIDGGQIKAIHTSSIHVYKSGLDAAIYNMAQNNSVIYGFLSILIAALGGLLAVRIFNKE